MPQLNRQKNDLAIETYTKVWYILVSMLKQQRRCMINIILRRLKQKAYGCLAEAVRLLKEWGMKI